MMYLLLALTGFIAVQADLRPNQFFTVGHLPLIRTRLDPIVNPGALSGHVHNIAGTSMFTENLDYAKAISGKCSTSFIQADMSGYWAPQLYYKYKNGTYLAIQGDGLVTYWKYSYNDPKETFAVVPDDFRMLGGNISRDFFDRSIPSHDAVSFQCFGPGYDERLPWIPSDRECENIRPQVYFPSCWNGVDAYLPDNSHVAYPLERFEGGPCPEGFVRIPNLFLEAYYKVKLNVPDYEWYPGCLVLSNGDNNGFSYHSDWQNGWPKGMLVEANEKCTMSGTADGCSVFEASRDEKKRDGCVSEGTVVDEPIGLNVPLEALPGNNPEYNSSRSSPDHTKTARAGYIEQGGIVKIPNDGSGSCTTTMGRRCNDYKGPKGSVPNPIELLETSQSRTKSSTTGMMPSPTPSMGVGVVALMENGEEDDDDDDAVFPKGQDRSQGQERTVTVTVTKETCPTQMVRRSRLEGGKRA